MKYFLCILLGMCFGAGIIYSIMFNLIPTNTSILGVDEPTFVWNDDFESIPVGGTMIYLEDWDEKNNTVYLSNSPVDPEYVISLLPDYTAEIWNGTQILKCKFEDIPKALEADNL